MPGKVSGIRCQGSGSRVGTKERGKRNAWKGVRDQGSGGRGRGQGTRNKEKGTRNKDQGARIRLERKEHGGNDYCWWTKMI